MPAALHGPLPAPSCNQCRPRQPNSKHMVPASRHSSCCTLSALPGGHQQHLGPYRCRVRPAIFCQALPRGAPGSESSENSRQQASQVKSKNSEAQWQQSLARWWDGLDNQQKFYVIIAGLAALVIVPRILLFLLVLGERVLVGSLLAAEQALVGFLFSATALGLGVGVALLLGIGLYVFLAPRKQ